MTDIARKAGIPIGSLYQYFPEKAAIIKALYDQLSADVSTKVQAAFASIDSLEDAVSRAESIVDWYFEEFTRNPLHIEIWLGVETDRELLHLNARESWQASEIFCNAVRPFLDRSKIDIEARALVLTHLTGAAVRLAVFQPNEDLARRILNEWKYVLRQTFFA
jgi:AcrR family transcriptional regulator